MCIYLVRGAIVSDHKNLTLDWIDVLNVGVKRYFGDFTSDMARYVVRNRCLENLQLCLVYLQTIYSNWEGKEEIQIEPKKKR